MAEKLQVLPVFFDIETTTLDANYGRILCGCVKPYGLPAKVFRCDDSKKYKAEPWNDMDVTVAIRDELESSYQIYGYNTVMFDIKFVQSRLLKHEQRPLKKPLHKDLLFTCKSNLALNNNRLQTVQEFLGCTKEKTRLDPEVWIRAAAGDQGSLDYIVEHCIADVEVLEEVFDRLASMIGMIYKG